MNPASDRLLKDYRLRSTPGRQEILRLFLKKDYALSYGDIEKQLASTSDRVTVYRTIKTFLDKGLIHKVLDDEGALKYALCSNGCTTALHKHEHVHFKCTKCGQTSCLAVQIPHVKLPKGYRANELNLLIQGICELCS
jgi:Fur family ferric uptake transcriptional regulator